MLVLLGSLYIDEGVLEAIWQQTIFIACMELFQLDVTDQGFHRWRDAKSGGTLGKLDRFSANLNLDHFLKNFRLL